MQFNAISRDFEKAIIAQKSLALSLILLAAWKQSTISMSDFNRVNVVSDVEDQSFQTKRSLLKKMVLAVAAATWIDMD